MAYKILIVDDEKNITLTFSSLLTDQGYKCDISNSAEDALLKASKNNYDLVLLDLHLPGKSGIDFLKEKRQLEKDFETLVISGQSEISTALEAIKLGALDYLEKPVPPERLIASTKIALMVTESKKQMNLVLDTIDESSKIIGSSKPIKQLLKTITRIAPTDSTVLITGENGTGKELVATRIYLESKRSNKPFIKVNCPGIPQTLFESELFGHKKGAYTGAIKDYPGKFVLADKGTLFLDEIGDLPLECQSKLLRVLETGDIEPLGSTESYQTDVRIICATNRNLEQLIRDGKFREDLYYRISVLSIDVPTLRDRRDDIPALAGSFLKRYDPSGKTVLSGEALAYLTTLPYPGNIRELKNIIERTTILNRGKEINLDDLKKLSGIKKDSEQTPDKTTSLSDRLKEYETEIIKRTLIECDNNISKAAKQLNIDRSNLSKKIKDLDI